MKLLKILILVTGVISCANCTSTVYVNTHVSIELEHTCAFAEYTEDEKDSMTQAVGEKTYSNQRKCFIQKEKNSGILAKHNELHKDK